MQCCGCGDWHSVLGAIIWSCHVIGPRQKWSPGLFLSASSGLVGHVLVAKNGPPLPKRVQGTFLAAHYNHKSGFKLLAKRI